MTDELTGAPTSATQRSGFVRRSFEGAFRLKRSSNRSGMHDYDISDVALARSIPDCSRARCLSYHGKP
jgi:hypothetical protein